MTAIIKEEKRMDTPAKTYLQKYEEHINGYKEYQKNRAVWTAKTEKEMIECIPVLEKI